MKRGISEESLVEHCIKNGIFVLKKMTVNWWMLIIGGCFEMVFAASLGKLQTATGMRFWVWLLSFILSSGISMFLLFKAMGGTNPIPMGTAYAVWGAIGAVGTLTLGILFFKEPVTFWRLFFLATLIISVVGLQLVSHKG